MVILIKKKKKPPMRLLFSNNLFVEEFLKIEENPNPPNQHPPPLSSTPSLPYRSPIIAISTLSHKTLPHK
jgi:hypothetical protein